MKDWRTSIRTDGVSERGAWSVEATINLGRFRGGARATDLYRTLTAGIGGTPMPSFSHLSESDRWDLVYWIQAQQEDVLLMPNGVSAGSPTR